eukprot:m.472220 g.472220  ORF g.472220 m.472220 type:complete len:577 (-) comp21660_c0_seq22:353-2083(-)
MSGILKASRVILFSAVYICHAYVTESSFDVVVYGATPGGVTSAVAATRHGATVALLYPGEYIGGAMTGGLSNADYGMHASSVIGGLSEEFFRRVASHYNMNFSFPPDNQCGKHAIPWVSEPHVAEQVFVDLLTSANVSTFRESRIVSTQHQTSDNKRYITSIETTDNRYFGSVIIDASYEGSLMKLAGVNYTWGREANSTYNETTAGRLPGINIKHWPFGVRSAQLPSGINPFVDATNTSLITGVWGGYVAPVGGADDRVGSYDWRLTLTDSKSNWVPIPQPDAYHPEQFEIVRRAMKLGWKPSFPSFSVPGRKTDWKMFGTFGEHPNAQWDYPNGTWEQQQAIVNEFKQYALGLIHFFRVDSSVPESFRQKMMTLGLCRDEYNRSAHWMPQLYIRSALRMVGRVVLTQRDVVHTSWVDVENSVGVASYTVDIPGPVQTIVENGQVVNEGALKVPYFCDPAMAPFALPYGIMLPRQGQADNLLVPVAVSASHVAFNALRMEPTWMVLGHAAGVAAAMAAKGTNAAPTPSHAADHAQTAGVLGQRFGDVGAVNVSHLRETLRADGQVLRPGDRYRPQ